MYIFFALLYLATVVLSVVAAYDPALAWKPGGLLTVGVLGALGIASGGRRWGDRALMAVSAGCALLAAAVGGYFLLSYDWIAAGEGKFAALRQVGLWVQAHRPALPLPEDINGNVAGGALALLLPLGSIALGIRMSGLAPDHSTAPGCDVRPEGTPGLAPDHNAAPSCGVRAGGTPGLAPDRDTAAGRGVRPEETPRLAPDHSAAPRCDVRPEGTPGLAPDRDTAPSCGVLCFVSTLMLRAILAVALAFGAVALILTGSRGAWAGTVAGGLVAWALAAVARRWPSRFKTVTLSTAALLFLAALGLTAAVIAWPGADRLLGGVTGAGNSVLSRAQLWRDGLALIGDYPFTGSGAGSTMMVYSTYAMLLHVGYISHAHNLFLQIALEQGLPGLAAFLGLVAACWVAIADRREGDADGPRLAAAAGLTALMVHGVADAGIYTSYLAPVLFLPIGLALGTARPATSARVSRAEARRPTGGDAEARLETHQGATSTLIGRRGLPRSRAEARRPTGGDATAKVFTRPGTAGIWAIAVLAGLLLLALLPPVRAAFQANLAALYQTRVELSAYRWPEYPIQDALRRQVPDAPPPVDLSPAIARYRVALALDPYNVTANRRLGQIELSLGEYATARQHLEAAYAAAPWQRPVRQLLAEAYTLTGDPARAAPLWQSVDTTQGQVGLRRWWYVNVECRMSNVECGMSDVECGMSNVECGMWR